MMTAKRRAPERSAMKKHDNPSDPPAGLSPPGEAALRSNASASSAGLNAPLPEEASPALDRPRAHQFELAQLSEELGRVQDERDDARARYFALYDLATVGYITLSEAGLILEANLTAANLLGIARGAMTRRPISRFILREDQDTYKQHCKRLIETGVSQSCDLQMVRRDNSSFWAQLEATTARNTDGAKVYRVVLSDLTTRKQAEAEVRRLAAFPELNPNPVLEFSANGRLTYSNRAAQVMAVAAGGVNVQSLLPPDAQGDRHRMPAKGQPSLGRETKHGPRTPSWSFYPIASLSAVHCYVADITEHLRLEEQFRHSQKMDALGQLAAGVAHDFNNLLTIVQFETSLLEQNPALSPESRESVSLIAKTAERAANLTRQLLSFGRRKAREARLVDLSGLVEEMARLLQRTLGEDIALNTHVMRGLPLLLADPGMIEQVVMNLAVNARDAMPKGGQLDLTVREVAHDAATIPQHSGGRPGRFLELEVCDKGIGISPEHLPRIFEPFFTTKEPGKGTGLGLATVFGIVKQHDGWIEVASEPDRGTTFHVFLPVAPSDAAKHPAAILPAALKGGSETILVVEDDENIRRLIPFALERYGYRVLVAENGAKAVELLGANGAKVDLLITDMVMPGAISGRDLAQKLMEGRSDLQVIFVSGFIRDTDSQELNLQAGVNFLQKPFSIYALVEMVRQRLDVAGPRAGRA